MRLRIQAAQELTHKVVYTSPPEEDAFFLGLKLDLLK